MYSFEAIKSELPYYQEVILYYKINACPSFLPLKPNKTKSPIHPCTQHDCYLYHDLDEKRRCPFDDFAKRLQYEPKWCPMILQKRACPHEDSCPFAHTENEINYHPFTYKTQPCQGCEFPSVPKLCPMYHSDEDNRRLTLEKFQEKEEVEYAREHAFYEAPAPKEFKLSLFKTKPCMVKGNHNPKVCNFYHFDKDRRRPTDTYNYSYNLCRRVARGEACPYGDDCREAHNKVEELYHPEKYKRKFCLQHPHNIHKCEYQNFCSFAHSEAEIKIELLHNLRKDAEFYKFKYKTVLCPYIYNHDRNQCVYAHNSQDYRRDPRVYKYNPIKCKDWSQGQIFKYEEGGCPRNMDCEYCHGWKELEYHPFNYKKKMCTNAKNCTKLECPFSHEERPNNTQQRNLSMGMARDFGISPVKQGNEEPKSYFYSHSHQKVKNDKHKDSNFNGPIMPSSYFNNMFMNGQTPLLDFNQKESRFHHHFYEASTRPNSNISLHCPTDDDVPKKKNKKKKKKPASVQNKQDELKQQEDDFTLGPKTKTGKTASYPQIFAADFGGHEADEPSELKKPALKLSRSRFNDSFESLVSYTTEKTGTAAQQKLNNEQFRKCLTNALVKKGLDYTVPYLLSPMTSIEGLKSFSQKDFNVYPQIKMEDKEKIMMIIKNIFEEEETSGQIGGDFSASNNVFENGFEENGNAWHANFNFLENDNMGFAKNPFTSYH